MPKASPKPASTGLEEFAAETTSNPGPEEQARRAQVAEDSEAGDLVKTQLKRYGADRESAAGSWFLDLDETEEYLRACWYGNEGAGKTTHALTAANKGRVLVINAETGVKRTALQRRGINTANIKTWPDHASGEKVTRKGLQSIFQQVQADLEEDPNSWYAVVFDSFTEITYTMVQGAQKRRVGQAVRSGKTSIDREFMDRADYGQAAKWLAELVRDWRVLPMHVLVTALQRRDQDDDGKVKYGPATSPAVQNDLSGMMDILIMCKGEDRDGPNRGLLHGGGKYRAKDRFGVTPRVLVDPTFERYLAYYSDELTAETDPEQKRLKAVKAGKKGSGDEELDTAEELEED